MKIETPGCTNLVLPIKQKNKKDQHFVLRELDLHPIHTQMFANLWMTKGKENGCVDREVVCWVQKTKFENWMRVLMVG